MTEALRVSLLALHRYTITSKGASLGYFRLVEDPQGAWVAWPEIDAALLRAEAPPPALGVCQCGHGEGVHTHTWRGDPKHHRHDCNRCACETYRPVEEPTK
jgi:hypothetical protein